MFKDFVVQFIWIFEIKHIPLKFGESETCYLQGEGIIVEQNIC